jgi:SAM-dependent methyltransferase
LNAQYSFFKSVVGHPQVIPPGIDVAHVSRVIDVATGTGAWALDFVSLPEVHKSNIQVFACDISDEKFLQGNKSAVIKQITFFQQDITKPFQDDFLGTFDLVNLSFLSYALTSRGWEIALQNLRSLLSE